MLESFIQHFRRGTEEIQRRGEGVAQQARLRMELHQLVREQDALFAQLGRAYYLGAPASTLQKLNSEIHQITQDILGQETLVHEWQATTDEPPESSAPLFPTPPAHCEPLHFGPHNAPPRLRPSSVPTHPRWEATLQSPPPEQASHPTSTTASRIWRAKERERQQEQNADTPQ